MPKMTACLMESNEIGIREALRLRDQAGNCSADRHDFTCIECGQPVRAHKSGGGVSAHFEHLERNPDCSLSHK